MATAIKKCRVCGKPYEACHTLRRVDGVFRWQEVACSPECGQVYLERIRASRAKAKAVASASVAEDSQPNVVQDKQESYAKAEPDVLGTEEAVDDDDEDVDEATEAYAKELADYFDDEDGC